MRILRTISELLGSIALLFSLAGCVGVGTNHKNPPGLALSGPDWELQELAGKPIIPSAGVRKPTVKFDAATRKVSGRSGVNRFAGAYSENGSELKFGPLMGTRMAGSPEANALETEFLQAMAAVTHWKSSGRELMLLTGDKTILRFLASPTDTP